MDEEVVPPGLAWSVRGWQWHSAQGWRDCAEGTKRLQCQMQASVGARGPHVIEHQGPLPRVWVSPMRRCHPYQCSPPGVQARPMRYRHPRRPFRACERATELQALWPRRLVLVRQEGRAVKTQKRTPRHRQ